MNGRESTKSDVAISSSPRPPVDDRNIFFLLGDVVVVVVVVIVVILSFDQVRSQMNVSYAHEPLPMVRVCRVAGARELRYVIVKCFLFESD